MLLMRDGRTDDEQTREDRATQPMEAGWLSFAIGSGEIKWNAFGRMEVNIWAWMQMSEMLLTHRGTTNWSLCRHLNSFHMGVPTLGFVVRAPF